MFSSGGGNTAPNSKPPKEDVEKPGKEPEKIPPETNERFTDLGSYEWAKESIYKLVEMGIVKGTSETTYSPAKDITRADYAVLLARAFQVEGTENSSGFDDVPAGAYYAKELAAAKAAGIITGVGNNCFAPGRPITREDMMVMLYRAMNRSGYQLPGAGEDSLAAFADAAQVSGYAREAVAALVGAGVITGSNGRLQPKAHASRAEVAVMLARVIGLTGNQTKTEGGAR